MNLVFHLQGDLFQSGAEVLFNPVNCEGVSGAGLAEQFKRRFPTAQEFYEAACRKGLLAPGMVCPIHADVADGLPVIVYFPTKKVWREDSRLEWIEAGLGDFEVWVKNNPQLRSFAVPALGCGLGGLNWGDVRPLIRQTFARLDEGDEKLPVLTVHVYQPQGR